jgi:multidrug efflux system membrane fusion protein
MRKSIIAAIVIVLVAGGWIVSGQFTSEPRQSTASNGATAEPAVPRPAPSVRVRTVVAQPRQLIMRVAGRTEASRAVYVRAETPGRIVRLETIRGGEIANDGTIAALAADDRQAQMAEAKALLEQRDIEYRAATELRELGFRSETSLAAARAYREQARALVDQMALDIDRTRIRAPFAGVVAAGHAEVGDYLRIGDPVAQIVDLDPLLVVGSLTEVQVGQISEGQVGSAVLATGQEVSGVVRFIAPVADDSTRTYRFEIEVDNANYSVRAGLTARISLLAQEVVAHKFSPAILSLSDDGAIGVKIVDSGNVVRFMPVQILADETDGIVVGGLPGEVHLITVGQGYVVPGQVVTPVPDRSDGSVS